MRVFLVVLAAAFIAPATLSPLLAEPRSGQTKDATETRQGDIYFPILMSDIERRWYGKLLAAMKEPVLATRNVEDHDFVFRALYVPTRGHPVVIRYEKTANRFTKRTVMLSGDGGHDVGNIAQDTTTDIQQKEIDDVIMSLEKAGFWRLREWQDVTNGCDGDTLVAEAIKDGRYHIVVRWEPEEDAEKRGLSALVRLYKGHFREAGLWKEMDDRDAENRKRLHDAAKPQRNPFKADIKTDKNTRNPFQDEIDPKTHGKRKS
jgi:hypothetical protein